MNFDSSEARNSTVSATSDGSVISTGIMFQAALTSQTGSLDEKATALNDSGAALKKRAAQLNVTVSVLTANQA